MTARTTTSPLVSSIKAAVHRGLTVAARQGETVALRHNWLTRPVAPTSRPSDPVAELPSPAPAAPEPGTVAPEPTTPALDFSTMLHLLRGIELRRMPKPRQAMLSAGCSDRSYFDWVTSCVGPVGRHIGIELYLPEPDHLPEGVEWVKNSVGDMSSVPDQAVDLVFSGQNFEHLFDDDAVKFLVECHRVLSGGGSLVIDSPHRDVVDRLGWIHPEHTIEFTPAEAEELVTLAGFDVTSLRGVWLCVDPVTGDELDLWPWGPDEQPEQEILTSRAVLAAGDPEHSFVWWLEAVKADRAPDADGLRAAHRRIVEDASGPRLARLKSMVGEVKGEAADRVVSAGLGEFGTMMFGPYVPLVPGDYLARFRLRRAGDPGSASSVRDGSVEPEPIAWVDVADVHENVFAHRDLRLDDFPLDEWVTVELGFVVDSLAWGGQFRVVTTGAVALDVRFEVDVAVTPAQAG